MVQQITRQRGQARLADHSGSLRCLAAMGADDQPTSVESAPPRQVGVGEPGSDLQFDVVEPQDHASRHRNRRGLDKQLGQFPGSTRRQQVQPFTASCCLERFQQRPGLAGLRDTIQDDEPTSASVQGIVDDVPQEHVNIPRKVGHSPIWIELGRRSPIDADRLGIDLTDVTHRDAQQHIQPGPLLDPRRLVLLVLEEHPNQGAQQRPDGQRECRNANPRVVVGQSHDRCHHAHRDADRGKELPASNPVRTRRPPRRHTPSVVETVSPGPPHSGAGVTRPFGMLALGLRPRRLAMLWRSISPPDSMAFTIIAKCSVQLSAKRSKIGRQSRRSWSVV